MTDIFFPPWLRVSSVQVTPLDNTAAGTSIFSGATVTTERAGDRLRFALSTRNSTNAANVAERALLAGIRATLRGRANRLWMTPPGYIKRGTFPADELLTNNDFSNETSGWTSGSEFTGSVADRTARLLRNASTSTNTLLAQSGASFSQYAPYTARFFVSGLRYGNSLYADERNSGGSQVSSGSSVAAASMPAFVNYSFVAMNASGAAGLRESTWAAGLVSPGDYVDVRWTSLARCALVDNMPNYLLYSDQINNAAWTKLSATVTTDTATAPDGTVSGESIYETTATDVHGIYQSITRTNSAADFCGSMVLKQGNRSIIYISVRDDVSGTNGGSAKINLADGSVHTAAANIGSSTGSRVFVTNNGNGWWKVDFITRLPASGTTAVLAVFICDGSGNVTYTGNTANYIAAWRGALAPSGVPFIPAQTTSAASNGTGVYGTRIPLKGLPVSTAGLLLFGDYLQIGSQLAMVAGTVSSDAAGCADMNVMWPFRTTPANGSAVIINSPMGKFVMADTSSGWGESAGGIGDHEFVVEEDIAG